MYYAIKTLEISAAHSLKLSYPSKCANLHGHNWRIRVFCRSLQLNNDGMVEDFALIKERIQQRLDHRFLNEELPFNPTAENIARWITDIIPSCYRAEVEESEGNLAIYEDENIHD